MKVLALNSSPRGEGQSQTEFLLNYLVQGMQEAGAAVEVIALRKKKINYCTGCFTCWTKTPGICIHQDDMTNELFPKWLAADLVVYATPLYQYTVNAQMKTFIERTLPVLQPFSSRTMSKPGIPTEANLPRQSCSLWPVFLKGPFLINSLPGCGSISAETIFWLPNYIVRPLRP